MKVAKDVGFHHRETTVINMLTWYHQALASTPSPLASTILQNVLTPTQCPD